MQASIRVVVDGDEKTVNFEADSLEDCHERAINSTLAGCLHGVLLKKILFGREKSMTEVMDECYHNLGGQTVPYTVWFNGTEDHGVVDISPSALGEYYYQTMDEASKERFRYHVQGTDCPTGDRCPVLQLAQAFGIDGRFRADH